MLRSACNRVYNLVTADDMLQMDLWVENSIGYAESAPDLYFVMPYYISEIQYTILCGYQKNQPKPPESKLEKKKKATTKMPCYFRIPFLAIVSH